MNTDKDWTGNSRSTHAALGARNYAQNERETNDYYATEPKAAQLLMGVEKFSPMIWECACGEGHLAKEFVNAGYQVYATDLINRGYGYQQDVLSTAAPPCTGFDIITNPPYKYAKEFVEEALRRITPGHKVAMFLKLTFLEGQTRRDLFRLSPPRTVYVSSARLQCGKNGDFSGSSMVAYAWYVWEKGYTGPTYLKWIN